MNNDLISREALKKAITEATYNFEQIPIRVDKVQKIIDNAPTVCGNNSKWCESCVSKGKCASTRPQGEWIKVVNKISERETETHWECSKCHNPDFRLGEAEFCSFCGAEMQKGGAE